MYITFSQTNFYLYYFALYLLAHLDHFSFLELYKSAKHELIVHSLMG